MGLCQYYTIYNYTIFDLTCRNGTEDLERQDFVRPNIFCLRKFSLKTEHRFINDIVKQRMLKSIFEREKFPLKYRWSGCSLVNTSDWSTCTSMLRIRSEDAKYFVPWAGSLWRSNSNTMKIFQFAEGLDQWEWTRQKYIKSEGDEDEGILLSLERGLAWQPAQWPLCY